MNQTPRSISPQALHDMESPLNNINIIDVRTPAEFDESHATGAKLFSLDELNPEQMIKTMGVKGLGKQLPLYVICQSGTRATQAAKKLIDHGYHNTIVIEGGTEAWLRSRLPVVRSGRRVISLQRQVQIAIGILVISKVMFGFAVHPGFFMLAGIIGAGLIYAGISNNCAIAKLIARMPWNKARTAEANAPA